MIKKVRSHGYNYNFDTESGLFARWGSTYDNDPLWSPLGPEILDIEVTTKCTGPQGKLCRFCYKGNSPKGENMSLETFKKILHNLPKNLTQCAFGADAKCETNPEIFKMMEYCRTNEYNKIVPNITVADISDSTADLLVRYCGAVAVSRYDNKDICYNSVNKLTSRGLKQTNIHIMVSRETARQVSETLRDYVEGDERLKGLNAIVLLSLKKKGRGIDYTPLSQTEFSEIVNYALEHKVPIGFDSCSAQKFINTIKGHKNERQMTMLTEPCESFGMFSAYVNVEGKYFPCSFCEGSHPDFMDGFDVINCIDFLNDVWNSNVIRDWRNIMIERRNNNDLSCPIFEV